jgi:hypothetical protein
MGWIGCVRCEKFQGDIVAQTCALIAPVQAVLHRFSCGDETVQNGPKHGFMVQWGGSDAFVPKNSDAASLHELVH